MQLNFLPRRNRLHLIAPLLWGSRTDIAYMKRLTLQNVPWNSRTESRFTGLLKVFDAFCSANSAHLRRARIRRQGHDFQKEELIRLGEGEEPFSEPVVNCRLGHGSILSNILQDPYVWKAVPCPSCVQRDATPPYCFSYAKLLTYFEGVSAEYVGTDEGSIPFNWCVRAQVLLCMHVRQGTAVHLMTSCVRSVRHPLRG